MLKNNRMKEIFSLVRTMNNRGVCDVGTDHAHIPIELVREKKVPFAIATDISLPSIKKGEQNIKALGLSAKIGTFCANGTLGVPLDGIGDIIIAGMGGELIAEIILADPRLRLPDYHFILQPMTKHMELRVILAQNGFKIEKESCVSDGDRIYFIMSVYYTGTPHTLSLLQRLIGVGTEKNPSLYDYISKLQVQFTRRLYGLENASIRNEQEIHEVKAALYELDLFRSQHDA